MKNINSLVLVILLACSFISCPNPNHNPDTDDISSWNQVYIGPFIDFVGSDDFFLPWNGTAEIFAWPNIVSGLIYDYHWIIDGKITQGSMNISLVEKKPELDSVFKIESTNGIRTAEIRIDFTGFSDGVMASVRLAKFTKSENILEQREVDIFYSDGNIDNFKFGEYTIYGGFGNSTIALKTGWNFIERITTVSRVEGSYRPYDLIDWNYRIEITQDINDLFKMGYRWSLEPWI